MRAVMRRHITRGGFFHPGGHLAGRIAAPVHMSHPGIQSQARDILGGHARRDNAGSGRRCESEWGKKNGAPRRGHSHAAQSAQRSSAWASTVSVAAAGVDFVETGASGRFPSGYSVLQLHTGGYQLNFHRTAATPSRATV